MSVSFYYGDSKYYRTKAGGETDGIAAGGYAAMHVAGTEIIWNHWAVWCSFWNCCFKMSR